MRSLRNFILSWCIVLIPILNAQEHIKRLDSVPKEFEEKYLYEEHDFRPLWVGNTWQYTSNGEVDTRYVDKDTVINGLTYYKKVDYLYAQDGYAFMWERNRDDFSATYMFDVWDVNSNGSTNEELLLDSIDMSDDYYSFDSYRFIYPGWEHRFKNIPYEADVRGPMWYEVFGDTVLTREVVYNGFMQTEVLADGIGAIIIKGEGFWLYLSGAIIYGEKFGTIVSVDDEKRPNEFSLSQNYPNPFNPSTTIQYQVSTIGKASLKVYDVLGREISTILNEIKQPGSYEIEFDGSNLTSGVYFYVLESGETKLSRKMLLLK